jgi:hypothetical protein
MTAKTQQIILGLLVVPALLLLLLLEKLLHQELHYVGIRDLIRAGVCHLLLLLCNAAWV